MPSLNPQDPHGVQPAFSGQIYPVPLVLRARALDDARVASPLVSVRLCAWPCQSITLQDTAQHASSLHAFVHEEMVC